MKLLEAYDAGVARVEGLVTGYHVAPTPEGKCLACADGAIFLGVRPEVLLPSTPEEAYQLESDIWDWRYDQDEHLGSALARIQSANDDMRSNWLGEVEIFRPDDYPTESERRRIQKTSVSSDKIREFIVDNDMADLEVLA